MYISVKVFALMAAFFNGVIYGMECTMAEQKMNQPVHSAPPVIGPFPRELAAHVPLLLNREDMVHLVQAFARDAEFRNRLALYAKFYEFLTPTQKAGHKIALSNLVNPLVLLDNEAFMNSLTDQQRIPFLEMVEGGNERNQGLAIERDPRQNLRADVLPSADIVEKIQAVAPDQLGNQPKSMVQQSGSQPSASKPPVPQETAEQVQERRKAIIAKMRQERIEIAKRSVKEQALRKEKAAQAEERRKAAVAKRREIAKHSVKGQVLKKR
jgi:hypothetical protein